MVEYALALGLVAVVVVAAVTVVGRRASSAVCGVSSHLGGVPTPGGACAVVWGQNGSFTSSAAGGITADGLWGPNSVAVDGAGDVYIADSQYCRVLFFPLGSTTATRVYGQGTATNLNAATTNAPTGTAPCDYADSFPGAAGTPSATNMWYPKGIALDSGGNLYVADTENNRVLYFASGSTTASRVYGQGSAGNSFGTNSAATTNTGLSLPVAVAVDRSNNVYVSDNMNNRVVFYAAGSYTASRVYGQTSTTASVVNTPSGSVSAAGLNRPNSISVDGGGNLYVADTNNNRVLYFASGSISASRAYGQSTVANPLGDLTSSRTNTGAPDATTLNLPSSVTADGSNVYIADEGNSRLLYYPPASITATRVFGQADLTSSGTNSGGGLVVSALGLNRPRGMAIDGGGNLYIADDYNSRVLEYPVQ